MTNDEKPAPQTVTIDTATAVFLATFFLLEYESMKNLPYVTDRALTNPLARSLETAMIKYAGDRSTYAMMGANAHVAAKQILKSAYALG